MFENEIILRYTFSFMNLKMKEKKTLLSIHITKYCVDSIQFRNIVRARGIIFTYAEILHGAHICRVN